MNATIAPVDRTTAPAAWRMLALLSAAELLGMSLWFTASAIAPQLRDAWSLSAAQAGWLTMTVQLGFVTGTALAALLNLADVLPDRPYFAGAAVLAALANLALLAVPGFELALATRFLTGLFLAGVYPPAMKMIATWFRARRGLAIGAIVGALTIGKAIPYLVSAFHTADMRFVVVTSSLGAIAAAGLVLTTYREGPFPFERRSFSWGLVGTVGRHRETRLAIGGYLGHMWELYAMWAGIALFFADHFARAGAAEVRALVLAGVSAFAAIAAGGAGALAAGAWADRFGRENVAAVAMVVSGACALTAGWLIDAPTALLVPLVLVWGFAIVADSAQFSALVTEVAPRHAVGTALTLQTSLGFLLTVGTIWLMIRIQEVAGWGPSFAMLAIGPVFGIAAMLRLRRLRRGGRG